MTHELPAGHQIAGHLIEDVAGRGGMGVVYRARQLALDRVVALKLIAPGVANDPDFRERFKRESRVAASIEHPNVVPVHEAGEVDGVLYITMRYVEGTDLRELVTVEGPLDPRRAAHIAAQVGDALDAAHARGLVHRDIKPANVLIARRGDRDHVYLTDFGLTKHSTGESGLTKTGQWVGTLDYVAPEQLEGRTIDGRTDVYALGCVLYQALTGEVPFPRDSEVSKMWAHISEHPPPPSTRRPGLHPAMDAVVARAMAKALEDRFPSAGDFGRAALAAAEGRPVPGVEAPATHHPLPDATAAAPAPPLAPAPATPPHGRPPPPPASPPFGVPPPPPAASPPQGHPVGPTALGPPPGAVRASPAWGTPAAQAGPGVKASYGRRAGATAIDAGVIGFAALIVSLLFFAIDDTLGVVMWFFVLPPLIAAAYCIPTIRRGGAAFGQTPGKQVCGVRVVDAAGGELTTGRIVVREVVLKYFVFFGAGMCLGLIPMLLDYLWPLWDREGRTLHDLAAKTRVVDA